MGADPVLTDLLHRMNWEAKSLARDERLEAGEEAAGAEFDADPEARDRALEEWLDDVCDQKLLMQTVNAQNAMEADLARIALRRELRWHYLKWRGKELAEQWDAEDREAEEDAMESGGRWAA